MNPKSTINMNAESKTDRASSSQSRVISKETSRIVEAMDLTLQAESSLLLYFQETYGDKSDLWDRSVVRKAMDNLKLSLKILLGDSVESNLGELKEHII